jgi:hypothetical protein
VTIHQLFMHAHVGLGRRSDSSELNEISTSRNSFIGGPTGRVWTSSTTRWNSGKTRISSWRCSGASGPPADPSG